MFRFRLRTLLLFVLAWCLLCAFVGARAYTVKRQRDLIARVLDVGLVAYNCSYTEHGVPYGELTPEKQWEQGTFSGWFYEIPPDMIDLGSAHPVDWKGPLRLRPTEIYYVKQPDLILVDIGLFPDLRILGLQQSKITNGSLSYLKPLRKLEYLDLNDTEISDDGLKSLEGLSTLTHLNVKNTRVSANGIERLKSQIPDLIVDQ